MKKHSMVAAVLFTLASLGSLTACGTNGNTTGVTSSGSNSANGSGQAKSSTSSTSVGTVTLYTSDGLEDYYKSVLPAFERKYGAQVNIVTDGSGAVVNRLKLEKNSPKADVIVTMPPFIQQAEESGLLQKYTSSEDAAIPSSRKDRNGEWYYLIDNYINWAYNPQLTPNPPQTFDDLLKSKYKNQIAYSNPLTAGDGMAVLITLESIWGPKKTMSFLKQLEPNVKFHTKGTGYLDVLLNRGEIQLANGDLQMDMADKVQGKMSLSPLFLKPSAGDKPVTFEDPYVIGLVHGAPNSKGGQALIDYLLGKDAQAHTYDVFGLPSRTDIPATSANAKRIQRLIHGVQIKQVDWNQVLKEEKQWQSTWQSEVLNAYGKQGSVTGQ
ncbi:MAG: 2-aminoethylphosphonate ABC transporter substrate-binding protein [Alicyclobacillus sp.]|nr:2-aminoethylphosphonate ABC transporter substrate-binding protein [Alicyclobacillus sp.]